MVNNFLADLDKRLQEKNKFTELLGQAEQKTGLKRLYLVAGGIGILALWLIFGYGAQLLCNLIGFVYPAYVSVKAIESPRKDDDTKWLMYWVVFALFSVVEFFSDILLNWLPLYWLLKCIFLIWCFIPGDYNGTNIIYTRLVKPFFLKHQGSIDKNIGDLKDKAEGLVRKGMDELKKDH